MNVQTKTFFFFKEEFVFSVFLTFVACSEFLKLRREAFFLFVFFLQTCTLLFG